MNFTWINGKLIPKNQAGVSVDDSAYLYGHGVFETLRAMRGKILFLPDHLKRLDRNARLLSLKLPVTHKQLTQALHQTLHKNHLQEARIRLTLSQLPSGQPQLTLITEPFIPYPRSCYQRGGKLILIRSTRSDSTALAGIKSTNYLTKVFARQEIAKRHAVEGIFLNAQDEITEGASSNIFMVKRGILYTPPINAGLLPGVRRKVVMQLAKKIQLKVNERSLRPKDLSGADEIFVTSTLKDILPIRSLEGKKIGSSCPGPVSSKLMEAYSNCLRS